MKMTELADDVLLELKAKIDAEYKRRRPSLLRPGRLATLQAKDGRDVTIKITGKGPTNYTGFECDAYGNKIGGNWRCHPEFLTPILPKKAPVAKPLGVGADRPAKADATW